MRKQKEKEREMSEPVYFFDIDGVDHCDEERCLAKLLQDRVLFANERDTIWNGEQDGKTIVLYVNCNDVFAWACADAENLPFEEIGKLFKMHQADPKYGADKWCCFRRNLKPQRPLEEAMRKAGVWDDAMEALPDNHER